MSVKIGIVDGGFTGIPPHALHRAASFVPAPDGGVQRACAVGRPLPHGEAVATLVLDATPTARLLDARIASHRHAPTPAMVAAAVDWCMEEGARVINLSLGLLEDRSVLRDACARVLARGVVLVAAAPARGTPVFPAAYPGVLAVSGDARCAAGQWSSLGGEISSGAGWGCSPAGAGRTPGGASMATARFTGIVARFLADFPSASPEGLAEHLAARAAWHGREHKRIAEIDS
ncbi:S8 family serine peptidase [Aromatoleum toluclasticum]|uniref:subtilisin-like serine protease QhpE n=1 Tax=Aromatoleum toluclasticum TaxID=92003 RepID=UPI001D18A896|nr:S8 family serine peptidase [Aromatoleum toluclasticum]MCC4117140.1 S8 family serine peptidase [Aromatoleum toluclasticum]